ncbi:hypothetical protein EIP86_007792 [Pleurotus ostreatoroseus]|nr:hypothetical protein EIP86_007792 [Pleurotus ostreatoroseus]
MSRCSIRFPTTIPSAISVPTWGFLDVTKANNFSVSAAETEADKNNPDIVGNGTAATPIQHSTVSGALSVTPAGFSTPSGFSLTFPSSESFPATATVPLIGQTDPANADTVSGKKKTNVGAIVGGIVGGVGGALLIGGLLWYWLTHRKPAASASSATAALPVSEASYSAVPPGSPDQEKIGGNSSLPSSQPQMHEMASEVQYSQAPPAAAMPLYDPDDPSTFPDVFAASHAPATGPSMLAHSTPSPPPASSGSNSGYVPTVY